MVYSLVTNKGIYYMSSRNQQNRTKLITSGGVNSPW